MWFSYIYITYNDPLKAECFSIHETKEESIRALVERSFDKHHFIYLWEDKEEYNEDSKEVKRYEELSPGFWKTILNCQTIKDYFTEIKPFFINTLYK